jgi:predicted TIM-barrel fold metal-dependent hydrolase
VSDTAAGLVDAHHHLWDLAARAQGWLDEPAYAPIRRTFSVDDLRATATLPIAGRRLRGSVVVQCVTSVAETEELLALAGRDPLVGAVVGWADLTDPAVGEVVDRLREGPGGGFLRSLRHLVQAETDPEWLQRPAVERGLATLAERGLGYDVLVRAGQLPQAVRLAERLPQLRLVLDHAGKPPIATGDLTGWRRHVRALAAHPQVCCKVSGLVTEADHASWTTADIRPVWEVLLEAFGPGRLMYGSDWPVCVVAGGWDRWAETVGELVGELSPGEQHAIVAATATAFYRIDELPPACPEGTLP